MDKLDFDLVKSIAELTRLGSQPMPHPKGGLAVVLPSGDVRHLEPLDPVLSHVKQKVTMQDTASFVAYVKRFGRGPLVTTIFADYTGPKIRAAIDYHEGDKPGRVAHDVVFVPPWSEQWARWRAIDGKPLGQIEFADFIEENMGDVTEPAGAVFLDLVTNLNAKKKVTFESGIRLHDGSNQLTFAEEIEARGKGNMVVPTEFALGVPVFFGGAAYKVRCLLRYRIDEGRLIFVIKINRRLFIEQTAFADITAAIAEGTGLVVLNGTI